MWRAVSGYLPGAVGAPAATSDVVERAETPGTADHTTRRREMVKNSVPPVPTAKTLEKYGLTTFDYLRLFELQQGNCGLCGKPANKKPFVVDHDHATGEVRGLTHAPCNFAIGYYEAGMFHTYFEYGAINNAAFQHGRIYAMMKARHG